MKLSKQKIRGVIVSAVIVGAIADAISVSDGNADVFLGFWTGFTLFFPLSVYVLLKIFEKIEIENTISDKIFLSISFSFVAIAVMIFTFALYDFREGPGSSDMHGLVYLIGVIPAGIIGLIYGMFIAFNSKR